MSTKRQHYFWGTDSPLGSLSGVCLLIIASSRLSWAITVSVGLFWVYGLTTFAFAFLCSPVMKKIFPQKGRIYIFTCLSSFFGSIYILLFWMLCPFAAFEVFLPLMLIPLLCVMSGIPEKIAFPAKPNIDLFDYVPEAVSQAAVLAGLLIVFSIFRELLAYSSLSVPGSNLGMVTIINFKDGIIFPVGIFAPSAGALLLLGYFICLFQYYREKLFRNTFSDDLN